MNFKKFTKVCLFLNNSFNLYGDAIVENAGQITKIFLYSDLDILLINNFAICRRTKV
jgi:predicted NodU family carbamoyl transferase